MRRRSDAGELNDDEAPAGKADGGVIGLGIGLVRVRERERGVVTAGERERGAVTAGERGTVTAMGRPPFDGGVPPRSSAATAE